MLLEVKREFGIKLKIRKVDPDKLWNGELDISCMEAVGLLAVWAMFNTRRMVPLVVFDWHEIESADDLFRVLQED